MSRSVRFGTRRIAIAVGVVLFGVGGSLVGIQASAGANSAPPAPTLDHFLCYPAAPATPFKLPPKIVLKNQFTKADLTKLRPRIVQSQLLHCNPTEKFVPGATFPITNPDAHLLCYLFQVPTQPTHIVQVTNQFGQAVLDTGQPTALCLPTWKNVTGPPGKTPNQPPGLDHFTCYPVQYDPSTPSRFNPPPVAVQDQFAPAPVQVQVGDPQLLCLPSLKKVVSSAGVTKIYPANNPSAHLLCFTVSQTPFPPTIWDENQFGTRQLKLAVTSFLCLPSQKTLLH